MERYRSSLRAARGQYPFPPGLALPLRERRLGNVEAEPPTVKLGALASLAGSAVAAYSYSAAGAPRPRWGAPQWHYAPPH